MKIIKHLSERNYLYLAVIWAVLIAVLSLVSLNSISKEINISSNDKFFHFVFYAILTVLLLLYKRKTKYNLLIILFVIIYGIIIEILQALLTTNREADIYDAIANSLGAITGLVFLRIVKNKKKQIKIFKTFLILIILASQN